MVSPSSLNKIELHRHLEGSIDPYFLKQFIPKYYPDHPLTDHDKIDDLFQYNNFMDFLISWSKVMNLLTNEEQFRDLAKYTIKKMKEDRIIYAELLFSPEPFDRHGLDTSQIFQVIYEEFQKSGLSSNIIVDFVRNFGPTSSQNYLEKLIKIRKDNSDLYHWVRAISIGGDEVNYPASLFSKTFAKAKTEGFHLYAHAGEWSGASSVWSSILDLGVERIGHGIRAVDDPELLQHLISSNIMLDISITSNHLTNAIEEDHPHPVHHLFTQNVPLSLNTDDPGFFHTNLNKEYQKFLDIGFDLDDLKIIRNQSLESSFLDADEREVIRKRIR